MRRLGFDLILLGAPAAGKDTQAEILKKQFKFKPVESGKYWRRMAKAKTRVGEIMRQTVMKGKMTPVRLMKDFLVEQIKNAPKSSDLLFVGNPKLKPEAQLLTKLLQSRGRDYLAVSIDLSPALIKKRSFIRNRGAEDVKYVDNRIRIYKSQIAKTLKFFKLQGKLRQINGNQSISKVTKDILAQINDYQRQ